jgi:hypothetical protein
METMRKEYLERETNDLKNREILFPKLMIRQDTYG